MFESLSDKLQNVFSQLGRKGKLTEGDVEQALREVRVALLEADVSFKVVKSFVSRVRERAIGVEVLQSLSPAQQVIKIVHEELVAELGEAPPRLETSSAPPTVVMLVGLQGSGKTTTAGKLGLMLRKQGSRPLLVAADPYRPAAIEQLETLGRQLELPVLALRGRRPPDVAADSLQQARAAGQNYIILDTAGRLHVNDELMEELDEIKRRVKPAELMLVADSMTGQDAVNVAEAFHGQLGLTGVILTKLDGDARGGAALSLRSVTGVPIKLVGTGEKLDALEPFHPDRLASRILGMGDVMSLIERAQTTVDEDRARALEKKLRSARLDLEDFLEQLSQVRRMGPLHQLLDMVPGMSRVMKAQGMQSVDERQLQRIEAIVLSMTPDERRRPEIIGGSRKRRIARGSGTTPADVNRLLNQFNQMQKMMKSMASGKVPKDMAGMMGGGFGPS